MSGFDSSSEKGTTDADMTGSEIQIPADMKVTARLEGESSRQDEALNSALAADHAFFRRMLPEAAILALNREYCTVVIM